MNIDFIFFALYNANNLITRANNGRKEVVNMADKKEVKKFQMTLNLEGYEKLKIVAEKNQRSVVGQVAYWIYKNIAEYESENGQILLEGENAQNTTVNNHQVGNNIIFNNSPSI